MPRINEATDTDLKVIETLQSIGWKRGDTLLYQQEYRLLPEQQQQFEGRKSIKPDIVLQDWNGNILAVFENKFEDEKKALSKLRSIYSTVLKPRFLYACSPERTLFYDTEWKGLEAGEFRQVDSFMSLEEMLMKEEQAKQINLKREIVEVFKTDKDELSPRYAEAIISNNDDLNATFKKWFKDPNHKPFVAVSVDIMSTGVDIPCVRYIAFANLTKSVGKYIQMLGRGTRLDPKTGKFSFKVLDFVGLCERMEDNGKGTLKENKKVISKPGGTTRQGTGGGEHPVVSAALIDNPDPANLIQRVYIHDNIIEVKDNIPIEEAQKIFEEEIQNTLVAAINQIKEKASTNEGYEPSQTEIDAINDWTRNPEVFLDEGQLRRIYDFEQGSIWDFFLHGTGIKKIPTPKERIERGYESYMKTYNFNDQQITVLRKIKGLVSANVTDRKRISPQEIFDNPFYVRAIGYDYQEVNQLFDNRFSAVFNQLQTTFRI